MDAGPWQSSANRYYAFSGEKPGLPHRISKTPPPPSTRSERSPSSATHTRKSAPASPMFGSSTLLKSSLLDRISPKTHSPQSRRTGELRPLSPVLGDYLDARLDEEEEEQVIRVLDNNQELVYQRDFGTDEDQDHEGEPHESRNSSPVKKRKLAHPNQSTNGSTPQTSPMQNKPNQKAKRTRSHSRTPSHPRSNATSPSRKQPLDWSSGSTVGGGFAFGKRSGLTFGFAGYGYDTSAEVNTTGKATPQDRIEAVPAPEYTQGDLHEDAHEFCSSQHRIDSREPSASPTPVVIQDRGDHPREPSIEEGKFSGEAPLEGGEDHDPDHEADHEDREMNEVDAFLPPTVPPLAPPQSEDIRMESPPPPRESPPRTQNRESMPEDVQSESVASSKQPTPPPEPRTPQAEVAEGWIKSMEQHAEDLLLDIQKEFLSRSEVQASPLPTELERIIPGLPIEGDRSTPLRYHDKPLRASPAPILDGISPLLRTRSISPFLDIDHHDIISDAMSVSTHTPRSTPSNHPASMTRATSFPPSDLDSNDTAFEVDPELDQITKHALGDLVVHSLKHIHNLSASEDWENSDVARRAIKQEVDEHARDFLRLAEKLARRMELIGELHESTKLPDLETGQPMAEPILLNTTEDKHLEDLSPIESTEGNREPPDYGKDAKRGGSDVEMDPVSPEVPRSDSEDRTKPNDEPAGEQELDGEPSNELVAHVNDVDDPEYVDEGAFEESGLEIPGVWCAHTGKDRTDTTQEQIEVSKVVAARVRKWAKRNGPSGDKPGRGPVAMNLMCLQTSVMQELYASFEDDARPVEEFFTALKALKCTWPTGGKLMIQIKAGEPERTRTWFSHQLVQGKPLDISSVIHPGRVTLQFVQLADLSNYVFLLLVSEPEVAAAASPRKAGGTRGGGGAESKSKVDEYLSTLEFSSTSS